MRRREFITLLGGAAAWPVVARAQQAAMPVIGFVSGGSPDTFGYLVDAFREGLSDAGFVEGRNVAIEFRWAEGRYERLPTLLADLVQRQVSVLAATTTPGALAAKAATGAIPIVFATDGDPVQLGLVASLSRPGGNVTGATQLNVEVAPKRVELVRELIPAARAIALLVNPSNPLAQPVLRDLVSGPRIRLTEWVPLSVINRKGFGNDRMSTSLPQSRDRLSPAPRQQEVGRRGSPVDDMLLAVDLDHHPVRLDGSDLALKRHSRPAQLW
jgi:ABC transporter substrate binding protein